MQHSGAFVYENAQLSYINIPDGRYVVSTGKYEYNLTNHPPVDGHNPIANNQALSNIPVNSIHFSLFTLHSSLFTFHFSLFTFNYPFGLQMSGQHYENTALLNKFLYNGKEKQDQTGYFDYGFRQLDPQLGRWHVPDALAEKYTGVSPYAYALNDPINHIDIAGLLPYQYKDFNIFPAASTFFGGNRWDNMTYQSPVPIGGMGAGGMVGPSYEDTHTQIEGVWFDNKDIITITSLEAIRFVVDALNENNYVITFIEMPDGNIIPVASIGELGQVYLNEYGSIEGAQNQTAGYFFGSLIVESTVINWSEVASSTAGLALGIIEVVVGVVGEVPSGGIATAMIVDGAIRIGSNGYKLANLLSGNTTVGVTSPSNLGGWQGKLIDMSMGTYRVRSIDW